MTEQAPQRRRAVMRLGDVRLEPIVEIELAGVAQLHHRRSREGLRDRTDPILSIGLRGRFLVDVGKAERFLPDDISVADGSRADRRDSVVGLRFADEPRQLCDWRLRLSQAASTLRESRRSLH